MHENIYLSSMYFTSLIFCLNVAIYFMNLILYFALSALQWINLATLSIWKWYWLIKMKCQTAKTHTRPKRHENKKSGWTPLRKAMFISKSKLWLSLNKVLKFCRYKTFGCSSLHLQYMRDIAAMNKPGNLFTASAVTWITGERNQSDGIVWQFSWYLKAYRKTVV